MDYKTAGVDVEAGYRAVDLMKKFVENTRRPEVMGGLGGFSGAFSLSPFKNMKKPVLVSGTDGVGTKLKIAFLLNRHDSVGIDCVAMCVNDIACTGGEPLFFLDYIACGKNIPEKIADIVKGVSEGCILSGAALIGGETAEMPGFYPEDEYDLAGFAVGIVDEDAMLDKANVRDGDILIGLPSSGLHSNGYSLVRKVFQMSEPNLNRYFDALGSSLGEALLEPTRIYIKTLSLLKENNIGIKSISHITGGGFYENIPRMLPDNMKAVINKASWPVPPIFEMLHKDGKLDTEMMYHTFNMGIGMVLALAPEEAEKAISVLSDAGEAAYSIGRVQAASSRGIELC